MLGITKPFTVTPQGELIIHHDSVRGVEPFATILSRKRSVEGDADGRKKVFNFMELKYIYFMGDYDTIHAGLSDKERPVKSKQDAGLPTTWKPDELVSEGIKKYIEVIDIYIPSARILVSCLKGLAMSSIAIDAYNSQIEALIKINAELEKNINDPLIAIQILENNKLIQANTKEVLSISASLPKALESIKILQDKVRKEQGDVKKLQGDKVKRNREDPNK